MPHKLLVIIFGVHSLIAFVQNSGSINFIQNLLLSFCDMSHVSCFSLLCIICFPENSTIMTFSLKCGKLGTCHDVSLVMELLTGNHSGQVVLSPSCASSYSQNGTDATGGEGNRRSHCSVNTSTGTCTTVRRTVIIGVQHFVN